MRFIKALGYPSNQEHEISEFFQYVNKERPFDNVKIPIEECLLVDKDGQKAERAPGSTLRREDKPVISMRAFI